MSESNVLKIVVTGDGTQFTRTMNQVDRAIKKAQRSTQDMGHATVTSTQAASGAIRLLEGDITRNVRAVEKFITTIPGVGTALKVAFPAIGALALAGVIARVGEEVVQFIDKAQKMPKAIEDGFRSLNLGGELAVDELHKTNDELENQIAKLEGKPQNNLSIALDDARIAADKLAKSLMEDQKQVNDLLKTNNISWIVSLITGQDTTGDMAKKVGDWEQKRSDAGFDYQQAVRKYGPSSDEATKAKAALDKITADAEADMKAEIDYRKPSPYRAANLAGDQTSNLSIAKGYLSDLQNQDDLEAEQKRNQADTVKQQALQHAKELADAQKQAAEKLVTTWTQQLDKIKSLHDLTNADEANFWSARALTVKKGSDAYVKAIDNANKAMVPAIKALAEENDKLLANMTSGVPLVQDGKVLYSGTFVNSHGEEQAGTAEFGGLTSQNENLEHDSEITKGISEQSKAITDWLKHLNEGTDIQRQNADAFAEASLQIAVATGRMSRYDAAQVQAQLHTQEFNEALRDLKDAQAAVAANTGLSDSEKKAQTSALQNQIDALNGQRTIQVMQDEAQIRSTSNLGRFADGLAQTTQKLEDWGQKAAQLFDVTLSRVNDEIIRDLTVPHNRSQWGNVGADFFRGVMQIGLEKMEGDTLKALGLGSLKQRQEANVWVQNWPAGGTGGTTSQNTSGGLLGKLFSKFFGGGSGGGLWDASGGTYDPLGLNDGGPPSMDLSGMGDTGTNIPGFALGGDTPTNSPFWVGEDGPELMSLGIPAHVTPNSEAVKSGDSHSWYIDARGNNDPAATIAAFDRYMNGAAPKIAAAGMRAKDEQNQRRPLSARR